MVPVKYADLGFEITKFGANSKVLKFRQKPIFVFDINSALDPEFLARICDTYLALAEKRKELSCVKA